MIGEKDWGFGEVVMRCMMEDGVRINEMVGVSWKLEICLKSLDIGEAICLCGMTKTTRKTYFDINIDYFKIYLIFNVLIGFIFIIILPNASRGVILGERIVHVLQVAVGTGQSQILKRKEGQAR